MLWIRIEGFEEISVPDSDLTLNIPILPEPQYIQYTHSFKKIGNKLTFLMDGIDNISKLEYHIYENFDSLNKTIEIISNKEYNNERLKFSLTINEPRREEAYKIEFENNCYYIKAETEKGLYYGILTLSQLIFRVERGPESFDAIEIVNIEDYPSFELRGATEQLCHGQVPNIHTLKITIKYMSRYKSNILILNLEDIMGFDKFPQIGEKRGALTSEEIRELREYANLYYCELVPGFQCLGHLENFLYHPEFREYAEFPGGNSLDISNPKTYELIDYFYEEICRKFRSKFVHIEMDEAYDFGLYKSKSLIEKEGRAKALLSHIMKIHELLVKKLGKTILMYHDTLLTEPDIIELLPKDIKIIFWNYTKSINTNPIKKFVDNGLFTIVSPSIINWTRPFPYLQYAFKNMQIMASVGKKRGCKGYINSAWGDFSNENFIALNILPLSFGAYLAWNNNLVKSKPRKPIRKGCTVERYKWAFSRDFFKYDNFYAIWDLFEIASSFNRGGPWNNSFFIELWNHPFDGYFRGNPRYAKNSIKKMDLAQEYYNLLISNIKFNRYFMDFVKYAADIVKFQAEKILFSKHLHDRWKKPNCFISKKELPRISYFIDSLKNFKERYISLWNSSAKPQGLDRIIKNFENNIRWFEELKESIEDVRIFKNPLLESEWIGPFEPNNQQPFVFRKQFTIPNNRFSEITDAFVQGIANTYLKIRINGQEIGEVISRFYLSPIIYDNSVKVFNIKSLLKPEKNIIEVFAQEFTFSFVAINILLEIYFERIKAKLSIQSDSSWSYCTYTEFESKNPNWRVPKVYGKPPKLNGPIHKPDLLKNQASVITREFGQLGYLHSMVLNRTKSKKLANIIALFFKRKKRI